MPENLTTDERCLIEQARESRAGLARLYRLHYEGVFGYCAHRLFDRAAAEDVTSTVFLKMVEHFPKFKGDLRDFRCWLFTIATNCINSHLREMKRRKKLMVNAAENLAGVDDDCSCEQARDMELLRLAMLSLKERYQTVITLRYFEKMKLTDVADVVGSGPGTVRSQLKRGLAQLRRRMAELAESATREVI